MMSGFSAICRVPHSVQYTLLKLPSVVFQTADREFDVLKSFIGAFDEVNRYGWIPAERVETAGETSCYCGRQRE